jgi:hypothetical protein
MSEYLRRVPGSLYPHEVGADVEAQDGVEGRVAAACGRVQLLSTDDGGQT